MAWDEWNELIDSGNIIESPNRSKRPASIDKPTHIIIHLTGGNDKSGAVNRFKSPSGGASSHYLVDRDGTLFQFVVDKDKSWHAAFNSTIRGLYSDGTFRKYKYYFSWHKGYGEHEIVNKNGTKLVVKKDGSDWDYSYFDAKYGENGKPPQFRKDPNGYSIGIEMLSKRRTCNY